MLAHQLLEIDGEYVIHVPNGQSHPDEEEHEPEPLGQLRPGRMDLTQPTDGGESHEPRVDSPDGFILIPFILFFLVDLLHGGLFLHRFDLSQSHAVVRSELILETCVFPL